MKQRIIKVVIGLALLAAVVGSSRIVADSLGLGWTLQTYACTSGGGGGEC